MTRMSQNTEQKIEAMHDYLLGHGLHEGAGVKDILQEHERRICKQENYTKSVIGGFGIVAAIGGVIGKVKGWF